MDHCQLVMMRWKHQHLSIDSSNVNVLHFVDILIDLLSMKYNNSTILPWDCFCRRWKWQQWGKPLVAVLWIGFHQWSVLSWQDLWNLFFQLCCDYGQCRHFALWWNGIRFFHLSSLNMCVDQNIETTNDGISIHCIFSCGGDRRSIDIFVAVILVPLW